MMSNELFRIDKLQIISLNANSIYSSHKRDSINDLLKRHDPDILCLNETKLNEKNRVPFAGYELLRNDLKGTSSRNRWETAILIKGQYKYKHINNPITLKFHILQSTIIQLDLPNNSKLLIISVYAPKQTPQILLMSYIKLDDLNKYYIITGDLKAKNADWSKALPLKTG